MAVRAVKKVGRFKVEIELANNDDMAAVRRGYLAPEKVRRVKILGVVDSGASGLVLPTAVAKQLGIPATGEAKVTYANGKWKPRDMVEGVHLELLGRTGVFHASLESERGTAFIGANVMKELDFVVDFRTKSLYPRDPNYVIRYA